MTPKERIFVPIDTPDIKRAADLARMLSGEVGGVKIGKELFTAQGPDAVRNAIGGEPLFVDLKFHDIPNTVAGAIRASLHMRPFMVNVHASGGKAMMQAAAEAARESSEDLGVPRPLVLGVTVLTSMDDSDLADVGQKGPAAEQVKRLALLAQESGLDGVVCSSREIALLRKACGPDFTLVVPGIRPLWASADDQKRIMTPADAIKEGADYLVIGRPITAADDPVAAARRIVAEL
ncbi:orotidine-5'-phosphate decarboxylase [Kiloniella laminariae]|uniref:Orotidine 5'-phosphate decarboxylase n=1 Tax=Kiloniella laminariae TaxID=454162 RepID=A0ABT4LJW4_9PROT|nr:orotidine-5'-phosphate decarboxylase [Kiloniella laminariae]MCZ4281390.1 orotidine-5'-phosphate decarboxylase [Kiloniella laminariae]